MSKAFKKGELVTYIASYDNKGTCYFRHAVVFSCGAKQMVLTDEASGVEMGRRFRPVEATDVFVDNTTIGMGFTFKRLSDEEATALCLKMGEQVVAYETANFERCLNRSGACDAYRQSVESQRAALHEPRAKKL